MIRAGDWLAHCDRSLQSGALARDTGVRHDNGVFDKHAVNVPVFSSD